MQQSNPRTRAVMRRAAERLAAGEGLAQALRGDEGVLDAATLELLAGAEEAGKLEPALERAAAREEEAQRLRGRALLAGLYPAYLLGALVLLGPLLELPAAISAANGQTAGMGGVYLHGLLRSLFAASLALGALFALPLGIAALGAELGWDRVRRHLPLLGGAHLALQRARFATGFGSALEAGLSAERALELACRASGSASLAARAPAAREAVRRGGSFADALTALELFDPADLGQLAVAERTGDLDRVAARLGAEHWEVAVRRIRVATLVAAAAAGLVAAVAILVKVLGALLGPVAHYYTLDPGE